ncbi:CAP domain-containing protein [Streptomyces sp. NPDC026206]|uniref:CAP domain-containing protein n=1 Tax=Streptomyces sp. NPDC026206 TaxID=3157089 RepID=UPI0033F3AD50
MRFARPIAVAAALTFTTLMLATAPASAAPAPQEIKDQTLASANAARAKYGARPLTWSDPLYPATDQYAQMCKFAHSAAEGRYGENLYAVIGPSDTKTAIRQAFASWMAEASKYDYNKPGFSSATGRFTQLVWKGTTQISLAVSKCPAGMLFPQAGAFVLARFTPAGNFPGQFPQNVGRPVD